MFSSLQKLSQMPPDTLVCPGHQYSAMPSSNLGDVVATNHVFKPQSQEQWLEWFGR
jgi:hypothetical protein